MVVVTDIDEARLQRCAEILSVEEAAKNGVKLIYVNTAAVENDRDYLMSLTDGTGFDDVFVCSGQACCRAWRQNTCAGRVS